MPYAILSGSFSFFDGVNKFFGNIAAPLLDNSFGVKQMDSVKKVLDLSGGFTGTLWSVVTKALAITKPLGIALIVTYFLMFMFDAAAKEQITVDSLVKVLIQLVMVVTLLSNFETVINAILSMGNSVYTALTGVSANAAGIEMTGKDIVNAWLETGEDTGATILIQSVLIWLIHQIAIIAIDFAAISRLLELGWRVALAPFGVANCFEGGASSPAIKYLKGIFGLALSGAAIYLTAAVGFALSVGFLVGTDASGEEIKGGLFLAQAALLATAGAAIGVSAKIKEVMT